MDVFLLGEVPEAGQALGIGQLDGIDDELGLDRLAWSHPDGDPGDSVGHDLDLARIESRVNQPRLARSSVSRWANW